LTYGQFGGSPIKVGEEEYSLFRDHEYVTECLSGDRNADDVFRLLAKINE